MPILGARSIDNLARADERLQRIAKEAIKLCDFTVVCSTRNKADQESAFRAGASKSHFGQSPHNYFPSLAIDLYAFPIDVNDSKRIREVARIFKAVASKLKIGIQWGGDWTSFKDWPHFELVGWKEMAKTRKLVKG